MEIINNSLNLISELVVREIINNGLDKISELVKFSGRKYEGIEFN